jgi:hypothetical protein
MFFCRKYIHLHIALSLRGNPTSAKWIIRCACWSSWCSERTILRPILLSAKFSTRTGLLVWGVEHGASYCLCSQTYTYLHLQLSVHFRKPQKTTLLWVLCYVMWVYASSKVKRIRIASSENTNKIHYCHVLSISPEVDFYARNITKDIVVGHTTNFGLVERK